MSQFKQVADALRLGATMCTPIKFNRDDEKGGCCALGAIGLGSPLQSTHGAESSFPQLYKVIDKPEPLRRGAEPIAFSIASLNNGREFELTFEPWDFNKIADWLESLDENLP